MKRLRLILHGKVAQDERVRAAVRSVRQDGHQVSVRVTWEAGDAARLTLEAVAEARRGEIDRIVAGGGDGTVDEGFVRSEEHTSELQSLMRISYPVFCLKKKKQHV